MTVETVSLKWFGTICNISALGRGLTISRSSLTPSRMSCNSTPFWPNQGPAPFKSVLLKGQLFLLFFSVFLFFFSTSLINLFPLLAHSRFLSFSFIPSFLLLFVTASLICLSLCQSVTFPNFNLLACVCKANTDTGLWWRKVQHLLQVLSKEFG